MWPLLYFAWILGIYGDCYEIPIGGESQIQPPDQSMLTFRSAAIKRRRQAFREKDN